MTDYYGDNDRHACAWLSELIKDGHLPQGAVDERDIKTLTGAYLAGFRRVHLFAGIGGWAYALELAGWPTERPVWTGSCPCQPFSAAGKRKGQADERHLWPVFLRLIRECKPATIFGEQVASDDGYRWLARVRDDLEEASYAVGCADLPACSQGAPHIRQRLFWVANAASTRQPQEGEGQPDERQGRRGLPGVGCGTGWLADAGSQRVRANRHGEDASEAAEVQGEPGEWQRIRADAGDGFATGGLDNPESDGRTKRRKNTDGDDGQKGSKRSGESCGNGANADRLEHSNGERRQAGAGAGAGGITQPFWAGEAIQCGNGKARRVEPTIFPLAHGLPGRVGLLRGAGNAIVPQVAACFIKAFLEAEEALS